MAQKENQTLGARKKIATLICAVVGEKTTVFVPAAKDQLVGLVKEAIKAKQDFKFPASDLTLYVAKKDGNLDSTEFLSDDEDGDYGKHSQTSIPDEILEKYLKKELKMKTTTDIEQYFFKNGSGPPVKEVIHVLVELPHASTATAIVNAATMTRMPSMTALMDAKLIADECVSLLDWDVGIVHGIPSISKFMSSLGGCTHNGKIFWRLEDKQVVSILVDGWFRESSPDSINEHANKKSILMGSPGIGKSILCV